MTAAAFPDTQKAFILKQGADDQPSLSTYFVYGLLLAFDRRSLFVGLGREANIAVDLGHGPEVRI